MSPRPLFTPARKAQPSPRLRLASGPALFLVLFCVPQIFSQPAAFPGAEGQGMLITGGRSGDVYHVTNLNDSGEGSLRHGLDHTPSNGRTLVFDVAGVIHLSSTLVVTKPNVTLAGQTAPGAGICLRNYGTTINAQNVIVRHLRFRPGDANKSPAGFTGDSLDINASGVMIDHCSVSWGIDECLSSRGAGSRDLTVQYCIISEGLDQTGLYHGAPNVDYNPGGSGRHSMGSLIKPQRGNGQVTFHHNLWACNGNRNPAVGTYEDSQTFKADLRNNTLFNNRNNGYRSSGPSSRIDMNYLGNYVIAGQETSSSARFRAFDAGEEDGNFYIYQSGNKVDGDLDLIRDGTNTGWGMFTGTYTPLTAPVSMRSVTTHSAEEAHLRVLNGAGAVPWERDAVDTRLIGNLARMYGAIIDSQNEVGGYPTLPTIQRASDWDTDLDGMPDYWEIAHRLDPNAANNNHPNQNGYTDLEHYLNWLADPHAVAPANGFVDVNLSPFTTGMATNTTFAVLGPLQGTVELLADGHTARFTPRATYFGPASFQFVAASPLVPDGMNYTVRLVITKPPPRFMNIERIGASVVMDAAGWSSSGDYYVLSSSNLGVPLNEWRRVATNQSDVTGRFRYTHTLNPETPQLFFLLQAQ